MTGHVLICLGHPVPACFARVPAIFAPRHRKEAIFSLAGILQYADLLIYRPNVGLDEPGVPAPNRVGPSS